MKAKSAMIAWTPANGPFAEASPDTAGQVRVGPHPDRDGWSRAYRMWVPAGANKGGRDPSNDDGIIAMIFINFHTLVVRDGIDPQSAHQAFLALDEYRERISPDIEGAAE